MSEFEAKYFQIENSPGSSNRFNYAGLSTIGPKLCKKGIHHSIPVTCSIVLHNNISAKGQFVRVLIIIYFRKLFFFDASHSIIRAFRANID